MNIYQKLEIEAMKKKILNKSYKSIISEIQFLDLNHIHWSLERNLKTLEMLKNQLHNGLSPLEKEVILIRLEMLSQKVKRWHLRK